MSEPQKETELFDPVKVWLEKRGYTVRGEVRGCDLIAKKDDEVIAIELKLRLNLELLIQAAKRQRLSEAVYVAVPAKQRKNRNWRGIRHLLRRLELGLILVHYSLKEPQVEIIFHPIPLQRRKIKRDRALVIREVEGRETNYNKGGSVRKEIVTAYRQEAIHIACCLDRFGELSPKSLREMGTGDRTGSILSSNFYGWFSRVSHGIYALTGKGRDDLVRFAHVAQSFYERMDETNG